MELIRRLPRRITAVSDWAVWSLPRRLTVFVLAVVTAYLDADGPGSLAHRDRYRGAVHYLP